MVIIQYNKLHHIESILLLKYTFKFPLKKTMMKKYLLFIAKWVISVLVRGVAQPGRVLGLGPRCRMFESCRPDHSRKDGRRAVFFCYEAA